MEVAGLAGSAVTSGSAVEDAASAAPPAAVTKPPETVAKQRTMPSKLDQDALAIAVRNLLDNAIAYSAPETEVQLKLGPGPTVTVTNESPALKSEILTRLHERFERGHQGGSGFGLGLAIVQQIIRQSGGSVELKSPVPGRQSGFQALVRLPASDEFDSN